MLDRNSQFGYTQEVYFGGENGDGSGAPDWMLTPVIEEGSSYYNPDGSIKPQEPVQDKSVALQPPTATPPIQNDESFFQRVEDVINKIITPTTTVATNPFVASTPQQQPRNNNSWIIVAVIAVTVISAMLIFRKK